MYLGGRATCRVDRLLPPAEFRSQVLQHLLAHLGKEAGAGGTAVVAAEQPAPEVAPEVAAPAPQLVEVVLGDGTRCQVDASLPGEQFKQQVMQRLLAAGGAVGAGALVAAPAAAAADVKQEEGGPAPASAPAARSSGGPKRRRLDPVLLDLGRAGNQEAAEEEGPRRSKRLRASHV